MIGMLQSLFTGKTVSPASRVTKQSDDPEQAQADESPACFDALMMQSVASLIAPQGQPVPAPTDGNIVPETEERAEGLPVVEKGEASLNSGEMIEHLVAEMTPGEISAQGDNEILSWGILRTPEPLSTDTGKTISETSTNTQKGTAPVGNTAPVFTAGVSHEDVPALTVIASTFSEPVPTKVTRETLLVQDLPPSDGFPINWAVKGFTEQKPDHQETVAQTEKGLLAIVEKFLTPLRMPGRVREATTPAHDSVHPANDDTLIARNDNSLAGNAARPAAVNVDIPVWPAVATDGDPNPELRVTTNARPEEISQPAVRQATGKDQRDRGTVPDRELQVEGTTDSSEERVILPQKGKPGLPLENMRRDGSEQSRDQKQSFMTAGNVPARKVLEPLASFVDEPVVYAGPAERPVDRKVPESGGKQVSSDKVEIPAPAVNPRAVNLKNSEENVGKEQPALKPDLHLQSAPSVVYDISVMGDKGVQSMSTQGAGRFSALPDLPRDFARNLVIQISDELRAHIEGKSSEVRVLMKPESLGELALHVTMEDGKLTARMDVSQPAVRHALEAQLPQLRVELQTQGIDIHRFDIVSSGESQSAAAREGNAFQQRRQSRRQANVDGTPPSDAPKSYGYNTVEYII